MMKMDSCRESSIRLEAAFVERVSSRSLWTDVVWYLDNPVPGQRNRLYWKYLLPDGTWTTDAVNYELLESFKETVWGMLIDGGWYGRTLKPGSVCRLTVGIRCLFRWMNLQGYSSIGALAPDALDKYLADIPALIVLGDDFYGEKLANADFSEDGEPGVLDDDFAISGGDDSLDEDVDDEAIPTDGVEQGEDDGAENDEVNWSAVVVRLNIVYALYAQGPRLAARGFGQLASEPYGGQPIKKLARPIAKITNQRVPPLPDEVAGLLLSASINWIDVRSVDVLAMHELQLAALVPVRPRRTAGNPAESSATATRVRSALRSYRFADGSDVFHPWHSSARPSGSAEENAARNPVDTLRYAFNRLKDACVCVLQYLVGVRPSEVCGIVGGMDRATGLPTCIRIVRSKSGLLEMFYLRSVLSKGVDMIREEEWLLACRPVGSNYLPLPVRALLILEKLMWYWREKGGLDVMVVGFRNRRAFPYDAKDIAPTNVQALCWSFKVFLLEEVDFSRLPDRGQRGESLVEYKKSKGLNITPRHGRKTFAAYILESRSSLLSAVKDHFKHLSVATTEGAYFPQSVRMRGDINSVITSDSIALFMEAVRGKKFVGRMAEAIQRYFGGSEFTSARDENELYRRIEALVFSHDLRIFFSEHGKCLIKIDPLQSRCRQATESAHILMRKPDYSVRSPGMCAGCSVFAADATNLPFWEARSKHYRSVATTAESQGLIHEYRVHLARAQQAEQFMKLLKGAHDVNVH